MNSQKINIFMAFYWLSFIWIVPGTFFLLFFKDSIEIVNHEISLATYETIIIGSISTIIFYILLYFLCLYLDKKNKNWLAFNQKSGSEPSSSNRNKYLVFFQALFLAIHLLYIGISNIPILQALDGNFWEANKLRASLVSGEIKYIPYFFVLVDFFCKLLPVYLFLSKAKKIYIISSFIILLIYLIYDVQKAPLIIYLAAFYLSFWGGRINKKTIIYMSLLSILAFYSYSITKNIDDTYLITLKLLNRIFILQHQVLYLTIEYGHSNILNIFHNTPLIPNFLDLPIRYDIAIMEKLGYDFSVNINMNGIFLAEAYSILGVIFPLSIFFVLGFMVLFYNVVVYFTPGNKEFKISVLFVWLFFFFPINNSFTSLFFSYRNILMWVSIIIAYLLIFLKIKSKKY